MKNFMTYLASQQNLAMLIARVLGGGIILWSAGQKWAGGGFGKAMDIMASVGIPIPSVSGPFILLLETLGGIAVILGLFTRYLGVLFTIEFIVAFLVVKVGLGYNAFRIDVALIAFGVLWATQGAGDYSLDKKMKMA